MSDTKNSEDNALKRVVNLPLVSSTLQMITSIYVTAKRQYPLLGIVGGVTELSVRSVSTAASHRAANLLQRPEVETVNGYALVGLEQLEKSFPILHQSADEVIEQMKETLVQRLDSVQARVNEELDNVVDRWEKVLAFTWDVLETAQASAPGKVLMSSFDELLTRSEEAVDYYLPLPPTLRREWEIRVQSYEDEDMGDEDDDDDAEPSMWTRVRSLLLCLYLQMYHRFLQLKENVDNVLAFLKEAADVVGLTGLMENVWSLLQLLLSLYTAQVQRVEALRSLLLDQFSAGVQMLRQVPAVQKLQTLPAQVRNVTEDLLELGQILIQLIINTTPLYDLVQQSSDENIPDFELPDSALIRSSGNSLFLKAMDGRPRRRRSIYARYRRSSYGGSAANSPPPQAVTPPASKPAPVSSSTPGSVSTPVSAPSAAPDSAVSTLKLDAATTQEPSPKPEVHGNLQDPDPIEDEFPHSDSRKLTKAQDEVQEPEPTEALDKAPDSRKGSLKKDGSFEPNSESTNSQDEISDPESTEEDDELPDPKLIEAYDKIQEPEPIDSPAKAPDGRKDSLKKDGQPIGFLDPDATTLSPPSLVRRRSSARELLFSPIIQFVSQSQRAFEYLGSSSYSEEQVVKTGEQ